MILYKDYIASLLKDKHVRLTCDCLVKLDVSGVVVDHELIGNEIIYIITDVQRLVRIGENTPKLHIEII